jgi:uncharacterized damage-inducible protein DinB
MVTKDDLTLKPVAARDPLVGRWLSYLGDGRIRTTNVIEGLTVEMLEYQHVPFQNTISTLLGHIAAIEMDWLYSEILEQEIPPEVLALLPSDVRDKTGNLMEVTGVSLEQHLEKLEKTRTIFIEQLKTMTAEDFLRARSLEHYDVTPEWVCNHLLQHEAVHRSQMILLRNQANIILQVPPKVV